MFCMLGLTVFVGTEPVPIECKLLTNLSFVTDWMFARCAALQCFVCGHPCAMYFQFFSCTFEVLQMPGKKIL